MDRFSPARLPFIATALLLAGKMQSDTPVDTKPQDDIRVDTQEEVAGILDGLGRDEIYEFSNVPTLLARFEFESGFTPPSDQFEGPTSPQAISSDDQPFLPPRRRKGQKPRREDFDSSCPPPPPPFFPLSSLEDLFGRRSENIIMSYSPEEPYTPYRSPRIT